MKSIRLQGLSSLDDKRITQWLTAHGILYGSYHMGFGGLETIATGDIEFHPVITFIDTVELSGADLTEFVLKFGA